MSYKMDFVNDMNNILGEWLRRNKIPIHAKDNNNILEFSRYYRLCIIPTPRKVYISKELKQSIKFTKYQKEITLIKDTFEKGEDIMPFMSMRRNAKKGQNPYNDALLNNWHMHHFHLNLEKDNLGYIKRSKDLLFCIVKPESVYMIDIQSHQDNWADKRLLEIVDSNWSELLEPFKVKGITSAPNQKTYEESRKNNINCLICINGKILCPFDFSISADGTSSVVNYWADKIVMQLKNFEYLFNNEPTITQNIKNNSRIELIDCFSFQMDNSTELLSLFFQTNNEDKIHILYDEKSRNTSVTIIKKEIIISNFYYLK